MPLFYGNSMEAFTRLQEEIIGRTNKPTSSLWDYGNISLGICDNLLASSPTYFRKTRPIPSLWWTNNRITTSALTNIGLDIEANLIRYRLRIYGMLLGRTAAGMRMYTVLPGKYPGPDALYRFGIAEFSLSPFSTACAQKSKIAILRGSLEQGFEHDYE